MHFSGISGFKEIEGKKVGVFLIPLSKSPEAIPALVVLANGQWCVDCLPIRRGTYVWPIPDDSFISAAQDENPPYPYAVFINEKSTTGILVREALAKASISRN